MKVLMCPPDYYGVYYEINSWMHIKNEVNFLLAKTQWQQLYQTILNTGATIELLKPAINLPDMVFTANAGLIYDNKICISNFRTPERQEESIHFEKWFKQTNFEIVNINYKQNYSPYFEGAGDALFLGKDLIAGYGFRSEKEVYQQAFFQNFELILCELVDPRFYHLDTCFCPLNDSLAICYPEAFSVNAQKKLRNRCELIEVSEDEALTFACNAIVLDNHIILPSHSKNLALKLNDYGFNVNVCNMSEFIKAGGACKCLTLQLN